MAITPDKFREVHDRAGAESIHLIYMSFTDRANDHIVTAREDIAQNRIKTPEDRAELELTNEWYKSMGPFLSGMDRVARQKVPPLEMKKFNSAAAPAQYATEDFAVLERAHENAFKRVYANVMQGAETVYENLIIKALDKATQLAVDKAEKSGGDIDQKYCVKTAERFVGRLEGLMIEFHNMLMPDDDGKKAGPGNERKGPNRKPGGPRL